ncbi:MAG: TIR domain-containing protein [Pseudonocardiaceae bacterium]
MAPVVKRVFLSWCHADHRPKAALVTALAVELKILSGVRLELWDDSRIKNGEEWPRRLLAQLTACDYGLLLLSPGFLASDFIAEHELPHFVGPSATNGVLPVGLQRVALDGSRTLRGVERHQIFTMGSDRRFFTEIRDAAGRQRFVRELATAIRDRVLGDS